METMVSRKRVARIMRTRGPAGRCRRWWTKTTVSDPEVPAVDLLKRAFGPGTELDRTYAVDARRRPRARRWRPPRA